MRGRKRRSFDFGNFEITKREILVSVSIVAIMLLIAQELEYQIKVAPEPMKGEDND